MSNNEDLSIANEQRKVYDWYESRHSDDEVVDIYSPEWQDRIRSWKKWNEQNNRGQAMEFGVDCWQNPEDLDDLDFAPLFFAHPVAAFSLWQVLLACYEIDQAVCGSSKEVRRKIQKWRKDDKPFVYLKAEKIRPRWKKNLDLLAQQITDESFDREVLQLRILTVFRAIEKLEKSVSSVEENFGVAFSRTQIGAAMLKRIRDGVDSRCSMITDILNTDRIENTNESKTSERQSGDSSFEYLTPSFNDMLFALAFVSAVGTMIFSKIASYETT